MQISIAIPDSCLEDESTKLEKSRKISSIARAAAIFEVDTIFVYDEGGSSGDRNLLLTTLRYLETPPFLRKLLFPKVNTLKYAGVLHPLKIPSHIAPTNPKQIRDGEIREGVVVNLKGQKFINIGTPQPIRYYGKRDSGRITIRFKKGFPELEFKEISYQDVKSYWGYRVKARSKLHTLLSSWKDKIILTSKKGKLANSKIVKMYQKEDSHILIAFGSIEKGVHDILGSKIRTIQNSRTLNFFPKQSTETIRLEEAIFGTLAVMNFNYE